MVSLSVLLFFAPKINLTKKKKNFVHFYATRPLPLKSLNSNQYPSHISHPNILLSISYRYAEHTTLNSKNQKWSICKFKLQEIVKECISFCKFSPHVEPKGVIIQYHLKLD